MKETSRNTCIQEQLHGPIEVVQEDSNDGNDDESMMEDIPDFCITLREALVLLHEIMCTTGIDEEDHKSPSKLNERL